MRRALILCVLACGWLTAAACAVRTSRVTAPLVDVDALVRQGCYRCLEQAYVESRRDRQRAFEVSLLLAARSKELGLAPDRWLTAAGVALASLRGAFRLYLDVVQALPLDPMSGDRDAILTETRIRRIGRDVINAWRAALRAGPASPLLSAYLDLALACGYDDDGRDATLAAHMAEHGGVPLLAYRAGVCAPSEHARLRAVRDADERLVDADYMLASYAAGDPLRPDEVEAMRRFESAMAAFPDSAAIRVRYADLLRAQEDWPAALDAYDAVLALVPTHRDALLGRTISLTYLDRHTDALASASKLIELGTWFIGEAYYWRAWNEYQQDDYPAARADTNHAKSMIANSATFMLSGLIEWRSGRLASSEAEFVEALRMDPQQCDAAMLLGSVRAELRKWKEGANAFSEAQRCSERDIQLRTAIIEKLKQQGYTPDMLARHTASQQRALERSQKRRADAERNAAELMNRFMNSFRNEPATPACAATHASATSTCPTECGAARAASAARDRRRLRRAKAGGVARIVYSVAFRPALAAPRSAGARSGRDG